MNNTEFNDFVKKMDKLDESISLSAMESLKNIDILIENGTIDRFQSLKTPLDRRAFIQNSPELKKFIDNLKYTYFALAESLKNYTDLSNSLSGKSESQE